MKVERKLHRLGIKYIKKLDRAGKVASKAE